MLDFAPRFWNCWVWATRCFFLFFCFFLTKKCSNPFYFCRVICKLLASKSESIRVQALKVLGYFLKHLGHKWVHLSRYGLLYNPSWSSVLSVCRIMTNKGTLNLFFFSTMTQTQILLQDSGTRANFWSTYVKTRCSQSQRTTAAQPLVSLATTVCLCVFAKDNVLIIKSGRNNRSDNAHWQGGGTLMGSNECWGINLSHVTRTPISAQHGRGLRCCTWAPNLQPPTYLTSAHAKLPLRPPLFESCSNAVDMD